MRKQNHQVDQISQAYAELKDRTWLRNARRRSQRRKSAWNLLLPLFALPLWGAFTFVFVSLAWLALIALHPEHAGFERLFFAHINGAAALILIPFFIASVCPALIVTNFLVYLIPPARRAMEREDRDFPGTDYKSSQSALAKIGAVVLGAATVLALIGVAIG